MVWITGVRTAFFLPLKKTTFYIRNVKNFKFYSCYFGKWDQPQGFQTGITVYNSAASKKVPLVLKNKGVATWYICGPTVYDDAHIGHASCYTKFDIIRRILENIFGIKVILLLGITDIDDKIIKKSKETGSSVSEISRFYEHSFFEDMETMRVIPPSSVSRVTDNIPQIISFCEKLIQEDFAYVSDKGNVYFKVEKSVSSNILSEMPEEGELIDPMKKDRRDFVLWKTAKENEPYWISPWGRGRPGWHIECSVMASNVFGSSLDLHSGGYDLLFPHHTNEKSQSEAYHGCAQWVNYWLHSGLLQVGDEIKMSKSVKNTISVKEFLKENSVNDFRIFCLQSPLRKNMIYCIETLTGAKGLHKKFHNFINEVESYKSGEVVVSLMDENTIISKLKSTEQDVLSLLADDFSTGLVLLKLTTLVDAVNENLKDLSGSVSEGIDTISACSEYLDRILETLGVFIMCKQRMSNDFVVYVNAVSVFRNQIRLYALCQDQTGSSAENYISDSYNTFQSKTKRIKTLETEISNMKCIQKEIDLFLEQILKTASSITLSCATVNKKAEIKKRTPLLIHCDELRKELAKKGIALKDRKNDSTWIPMTTLNFEYRKN